MARSGPRAERGWGGALSGPGVGRTVHGTFGGSNALGVEQAVVGGPESQLDEGAGIGQSLGLPAVVPLVLHQGFPGGVVPDAGGLAGEIALTDERGLDLAGAVGLDGLLSLAAPIAAGGPL